MPTCYCEISEGFSASVCDSPPCTNRIPTRPALRSNYSAARTHLTISDHVGSFPYINTDAPNTLPAIRRQNQIDAASSKQCECRLPEWDVLEHETKGQKRR